MGVFCACVLIFCQRFQHGERTRRQCLWDSSGVPRSLPAWQLHIRRRSLGIQHDLTLGPGPRCHLSPSRQHSRDRIRHSRFEPGQNPVELRPQRRVWLGACDRIQLEAQPRRARRVSRDCGGAQYGCHTHTGGGDQLRALIGSDLWLMSDGFAHALPQRWAQDSTRREPEPSGSLLGATAPFQGAFGVNIGVKAISLFL